MAGITLIRPIAGYPGYWVTADGHVCCTIPHNGTTGRRLKPQINSYGYRHVILHRDGKKKTRAIHRLVLETFVGPCPEGMEACHFPDRTKTNNRLENLRWDTFAANEADKIKHGTRPNQTGERHGGAKLSDYDARMIIYAARTGEITQHEIAKAYGICDAVVSEIVNDRRWRHLWI